MNTISVLIPPGNRRFARPVLLSLLLLAAPWPIWAGESRIELKDGSVLTGELVGVEGGRWRVRTRSLGDLALPESDVVSVRPLAAGGGSAVSAPGGAGDSGAPPVSGGTLSEGEVAANLAAIQRQMIGDPAIMSAISALQNDPELRAALADPEFARRVLAGDVQSLQTDPRFLHLLENPSVRAILGRFSGQ